MVLALIRFFVLLVYFILMNFGLVIVFLLRPMHRDNVYLAARWYIKMGYIIGLKVIVRKAPEVDPKTQYIYVANHQNTYDLVSVAAAAQPGVVTVGKKSLKWIPIFGLIYWLSGNIMIDRKDSRRARGTLELTAEKIRQSDLSVFMFPEGTRSRGRGILPFKTGAFRLAQMAELAVVPVCCSDVSKIRLNKWDNGTVLVDIMAPQQIDNNENPKSVTKHFEDVIKQRFIDLNAEVASIKGSKA